MDGLDLVVFYRVDQSAGCSGDIREPVVDERVGAVRVTLQREEDEGDDEVCVGRIPTSSVEITLDRPLGGRLLQDGARGGSLVPPMAALP